MLALLDGTNAYMRYKHRLSPVEAGAKAVHRTKDWLKHVKASHLLIALDSATPNVRLKDYPQYKHDRTEPNTEYHDAGREAFHAEGWFWMQSYGHEADDIIATIVERSKGPVCTLSSDTDLLALSCDRVHTYVYGVTGEFVRLDPQAVFDKFGVWPEQLTEYKALIGEDGVAGVPKVGKKKAATLITKHGTIAQMTDALGSYYDTAVLAARTLALRTTATLPTFTREDCVLQL